MAPLDGRPSRSAAWGLASLVLASALVGCISDPSAQLTARRGDLAEIELVVADGDLVLPSQAGTVTELCGEPLPELGSDGCPAARANYVLLDDPPAHLPEGFANASGLPSALVDELEGIAEGDHRSLEDVQAWGSHSEDLVERHDRRGAIPRTVEAPQAYGRTWNGTDTGEGFRIEPREAEANATVQVPEWCNERFCLFTSELVGWNATHLFVEHRAQAGQQVRAGELDTFLTVREADEDGFTVDGNDPRAGRSFDVYAHVVDLRGPSEGERRAPSFELTSLSGEPVRLESMLGTPTVIEFFATWCPSCAENADHLVQVDQRFGDEVDVVSIGVDPWESPDSLHSFVDEHGITWPVAVDEDGDVSNDYGVGTLSTEVIVDAHGVIRHVETGVADHERVVDVLETLIGQGGGEASP